MSMYNIGPVPVFYNLYLQGTNQVSLLPTFFVGYFFCTE
jgi:hypothetical protein